MTTFCTMPAMLLLGSNWLRLSPHRRRVELSFNGTAVARPRTSIRFPSSLAMVSLTSYRLFSSHRRRTTLPSQRTAVARSTSCTRMLSLSSSRLLMSPHRRRTTLPSLAPPRHWRMTPGPPWFIIVMIAPPPRPHLLSNNTRLHPHLFQGHVHLIPGLYH
jgi:hypothetical protein